MKNRILSIFQLVLIAILTMGRMPAGAQTNNCTSHAFTNGAGSITFNVQNTNPGAIIVTDILSTVFNGAGGTYTFTLLYNTTAVASSGATWTQGIVGVGQNGWQLGGSATVTIPAHTTPQSVITGLNINIPPGATYGFGLTVNTSIGYETIPATTNTFSNGGVNLITGLNVGWGGGAYPATPVNYPRGWNGCVGWISALPCVDPPTPGTATATPSSGVCSGQNVALNLTGNSGGTGQSYQWESSPSMGGPYTSIGSPQASPLLNTTVTSTTWYRCQVTCGATTLPSVEVQVAVNPAFPGGSYTINSALPTGGSNFTNFTDAVAAISCGISGPIIFDVDAASGPYNEQITMPSTIGATAVNTVTINGNGRTLSFNSTNASLPHTLALNGADYITVNDLIVTGTGPTYALTCHLWNNADNNTFNNCTFNCPANGTSTTQVPFSVSGVANAALTTGPSGSNNLLYNCTMFSGYYNTVFYGNSASPNSGNAVIDCDLMDFYFYGCMNYYNNGTIISGNNIERPTRSTLSTFYGIYILTGSTNTIVERNRIHNPFAMLPTSGSTAYGVYSSIDATAGNENKYINNAIYDFASNAAMYGFYLLGADYLQAYHNTISLDHTASTATAATYGIYSTGTTAGIDIRNNNVTVTRGGTGTKYCLYFAGGLQTSNNNDLFMNAAAGTNYVGFYGSGFTTLGNWQTANGAIWDGASQSVDPMYISPGTGDFTPNNAVLDNMGANLGVAVDLLGNPRSLTPDPGAFEFSSANCTGTVTAGTATAPAAICPGQNVNLSLSGYTTGSGITFQWQYYDSGTSTWLNIGGANSPGYAVVGQSTQTQYRVYVVCTFNSSSDTSNVVTVGMNNWQNCYCIPLTTNGCLSNDHITNVTFASILNNTGVCLSASYSDYTVTVPAPLISPGQNYPITVHVANGGTERAAAWIDYDHSGSFDATEFIDLNTPTNTGTPDWQFDATVSVPVTALTGPTRMRVRSSFNALTTAGSACATYSYGETEDYTVDIGAPPACVPPSGLLASNITGSSADLSWGAVGGAVGYEYVVDQIAGSPGGSGTAIAGTSFNQSGLTAATTYYLHVRTDCGGSGFSNWTTLSFTTDILNNNAPGAILLTVGGGCTGNPFTNAGGSQTIGEPYPSCNSYTTGHHTVWYKFDAPASGAVRVSTDLLPAGTLVDSKIGLYSATNVNDYTTFTILSCDEDGGGNTNFNSILYATGLTPATTYYIQVDGWSTADFGTFCLTVDELTSSMLAAGPVTCATVLQTPEASNTAYAGWIPLMTVSGQLVALVRNPAGGAGISYANCGLTVNTAAVRSSAGQYYVDRNFLINNATISTPVDVQLFFLNSELGNFQATPGNGSLTLADMNVTKQSGTGCQAAYDPSLGTNSFLPQTGNGSVNGVGWVQLQTSSFSNFFIHGGNAPLFIELSQISAANAGMRNRIDWSTSKEEQGDQFILERSADGGNFVAIGTVAAKGRASNYTYWDENPVSGVNYYRLKMVDASSAFAYSKVVTATVKDANAFSVEVVPNPAKGNELVYVNVYGKMGTNPMITIADATGKIVKMIPVNTNKTAVNVSELAAGMYLVKYSDGSHSNSIKLSKQ